MTRRPTQGRSGAPLGAIAASVWAAIVVVCAVALALRGQPAGLTVALLALALLPAFILLALAEMLARLQPSPPVAPSQDDGVLRTRLAAIESALRDTRAGVAALGALAGAEPMDAARRPAPPAPSPVPPDDDAPPLPFAGNPASPSGPSAAPPSWADVIRAMDFPRDEADVEGFDAVRAALRDPQVADLLQAAEDVLSMLAAAGLHMEDIRPHPAPLAMWRAYAEGARGAAVEAIGGVREPQALAQARGMLRADGVFRDAALVLAQRWGRLMTRMARELGEDPALLQAADSRTGRAFMLLARAMGAFD